MKNFTFKRVVVLFILLIFILSNSIPAFGIQIGKSESKKIVSLNSGSNKIKNIEIEITFSDPEVVKYGDYWIVRVKETNSNKYVLFDMDPGKPCLPVNISVFNLVFGSKIVDLNYEHSDPEIIDLPGRIVYTKASSDSIENPIEIPMNKNIYENPNPYPSDWVTYHTGGGLSEEEHKTFLVTRIYPVRYYPTINQLQFIRTIKVNISYNEPDFPIIKDNNIFDLLIISPLKYSKTLKPLVCHKNKFGVRTKLVPLEYIYRHIWFGRDRAEKIKLFIKEAIEKSGINYVLLVGGIKGQSFKWDLPVRYSRVAPDGDDELFISDLYFSDIYDSQGGFSSWDSDGDNKFSVWNEETKDEMDLYPDVYLGRLACRNKREVKIMVSKIINYEKQRCADKEWFKNHLLVSGDSYPDPFLFNEGELICEEAISLMPSDFRPYRLYANETEGIDINRDTVNNAMNNGSSFAYFCGHGSASSWSTHSPPVTEDHGNWTTGYVLKDMIFLKNRGKLPITVVGGCHNGQFDVRMANIIKGILEEGLNYFSTKKGNIGGFWYPKLWVPNCWSWWLASQPRGGSIATISNTGFGYHGDGDMDNNSIADYLEVLDGWLELRFQGIYGTDGRDILGGNHGQAITEYIHRFNDVDSRLEAKMVQQWVLMGDPSLKIGGYT